MIARLGWAAATLLHALPAPGYGDGVELQVVDYTEPTATPAAQ